MESNFCDLHMKYSLIESLSEHLAPVGSTVADAMEPSVGRALLEERCHLGGVVKSYCLTLLAALFLEYG